MSEANRKPWDVEDTERVWRCDEHSVDYGYVPESGGKGSFTRWDCEICAHLADTAKKEWETAWRRYQFWDRESNIPYRFRNRTLATWAPTTKPNETIGKAIGRYVSSLDADDDSGAGFVLLGPPGVGKSHLLTAVVAEAIGKGMGARYAVWIDVVSEVKAGFNLPKVEGRRDIIAILKGAALLALDELALKGASEFEAGLLFELVDHRYRERLPTLAASNATRESFPCLVGERVADRLTECSPALVLTGESQRAKRSPTDEGPPQLERPPKTLTLRRHSSGKWREETKTYSPPHGSYE